MYATYLSSSLCPLPKRNMQKEEEQKTAKRSYFPLYKFPRLGKQQALSSLNDAICSHDAGDIPLHADKVTTTDTHTAYKPLHAAA